MIATSDVEHPQRLFFHIQMTTACVDGRVAERSDGYDNYHVLFKDQGLQLYTPS